MVEPLVVVFVTVVLVTVVLVIVLVFTVLLVTFESVIVLLSTVELVTLLVVIVHSVVLLPETLLPDMTQPSTVVFSVRDKLSVSPLEFWNVTKTVLLMSVPFGIPERTRSEMLMVVVVFVKLPRLKMLFPLSGAGVALTKVVSGGYVSFIVRLKAVPPVTLISRV